MVDREGVPDPDHVRVQHEGQEEGDRRAQQPVADGRGDEGGPGVAGAPMGAAQGEVRLQEGLGEGEAQQKRPERLR